MMNVNVLLCFVGSQNDVVDASDADDGDDYVCDNHLCLEYFYVSAQCCSYGVCSADNDNGADDL